MYIVLKLLAVAEGVVLQLLHVLLHCLHIDKDTGHRISAGLDLDSELWIWLYDLPEIGVTELGVEPLANQGDYPLGLVGGESHVKANDVYDGTNVWDGNATWCNRSCWNLGASVARYASRKFEVWKVWSSSPWKGGTQTMSVSLASKIGVHATQKWVC